MRRFFFCINATLEAHGFIFKIFFLLPNINRNELELISPMQGPGKILGPKPAIKNLGLPLIKVEDEKKMNRKAVAEEYRHEWP